MKWPDRVQQIVNVLAAGVSHSAPDEVRRATTEKIAQQCRFELGPNWGWKRADPGRPLSTDVFCTREPFVGWDWSIPSGVAEFPESVDLTGQVFVEVEPVNHLGTVPDPGTPPPDPGTPDTRELRMLLTTALVSLEELKATVGMLSGLLASLQMRHDPMPKLLEVQGELRHLEVRGGVLWQDVTLRNVRME
jgi:hypothetical protein